jgi:hypothetical protein
MSVYLSRGFDWVQPLMQVQWFPLWQSAYPWIPFLKQSHWYRTTWSQRIATIVLLAVTPSIASLLHSVIRNVRRSQKVRFICESSDQGEAVPGPPASWWQRYVGGHYQDIFKYPSLAHWHIYNRPRYGLVYKSYDILGQTDVVMADPKGMHYILSANSYQFEKTDISTRALIHVAGEKGMLVLGVSRTPNLC